MKFDYINRLLQQTEFPDCHKLVDMDDSNRIFWLSYFYEYKVIGVEKDKNKVFTHYQKLADMIILMEFDNSMEIWKTAVCYLYGIGIEKDEDKFWKWYKKVEYNELHLNNDPNGIFWLGYFYEYEIGVEKDENKAFIHYQKSANMNNSNGMYQADNSIRIWKTAFCYFYGIGIEKDDKFWKWYKNYFYEYGIGVEKDENKAFTHYQKSADMNNSNRMYQVGYYYNLGIDVKNDKLKFYILSEIAKVDNSMGIWKTAGVSLKFTHPSI
ncbi:hypothetical protein C2G38_2179384 [Gigaspora rosea]|uniref:Uncharacterized protein n=1 Tax=Gigaspora rosea TaxID=44941 RepID=A0A397VGG1_9GLOM|nr:hypothetical protein C2G38_2179384 [Gigaspora rosea]